MASLKNRGPPQNVSGMGLLAKKGNGLRHGNECFRHAVLNSENQPKTHDAHQTRDDHHYDEALQNRRIEDLKVDPVFYEA